MIEKNGKGQKVCLHGYERYLVVADKLGAERGGFFWRRVGKPRMVHLVTQNWCMIFLFLKKYVFPFFYWYVVMKCEQKDLMFKIGAEEV